MSRKRIVNTVISLLILFCGYPPAKSHETFLYAPGRSKYVSTTSSEAKDLTRCKLCRAVEQDNATEFVLARTANFTVLLNLFPYGKGHILIVDNNHGSTFCNMDETKRNELAYLISTLAARLKAALEYSGLNVGYNEGRDAGASIPDHLHIHILPRFTHHEMGFIQILGNTHVVESNLKEIYLQLLPFFADLTDKSSNAT